MSSKKEAEKVSEGLLQLKGMLSGGKYI